MALWMTLFGGCHNGETINQADRDPVGLTVRHAVRVVYQIKTDQTKEGIGAGLYYVRKLTDAYDAMGIQPKDRAIHAVFHGQAGHRLLTDRAYSKAAEQPGPNPNAAVIRELLERGVSIELCASTMRNHGWQPADVLEGVTLVAGAYPRIIDLQLQGYAYIRF